MIGLGFFPLFLFVAQRLTRPSSLPIIENATNLPIPAQTSLPSFGTGQAPANLLTSETNFGLPERLKIPKIKVDAAINPMGITANGAMETPTQPQNVGWFKFGPRPGNIGSAVIDGHFGRWANGEGSVFNDLNKLQKGDSLIVESEGGLSSTFSVHSIQVYDQKTDDSNVFVSSDGKSHLNLITCEGIWDDISRSYAKRLVVFSDKE